MNIIEILRTIRYFKAALATLVEGQVRQKLEKETSFLKIDPENANSLNGPNGLMKVTPSKRADNVQLHSDDDSLKSDSSLKSISSENPDIGRPSGLELASPVYRHDASEGVTSEHVPSSHAHHVALGIS